MSGLVSSYSSNVGPGRVSLERAQRPLRGALFERQWAVSVLDQTLSDLLAGIAPSGTVIAAPSRDRYWADPFPLGQPGDCWLLVEEFDRWRGLGHIVALRVLEGAVVSGRAVLVDAHHASFPQAQAFDGEWIATVQTCNPRASIYRFRSPGDAWQPTDWALPEPLLDPALSRAQDGSWTLTGTRQSSTRDVILHYVSTGGRPTDWRLLEQVPAPSCARGGGSLDVTRGLRAAQCEQPTYGAAVSLRAWPGGEKIHRFEGPGFAGDGRPWTGCHTLAWTPDGRTVVMDLWKRRVQPLSAVHRLLEFRADPCNRVRS